MKRRGRRALVQCQNNGFLSGWKRKKVKVRRRNVAVTALMGGPC